MIRLFLERLCFITLQLLLWTEGKILDMARTDKDLLSAAYLSAFGV